jgi:hypothetical protein
MLGDLADATTSFCQAATSCCDATPSADCESFYTEHQAAIPAIKTGAVTIDAAALARCKAAYADGPNQCNLNSLIDACSDIFKGHQGVGKPCFSGYDCDRSIDAMTCVITDTTAEQPVGTCQKMPHAKLDEPCASTCQTRDSDCSTTILGSGVQPSDLATCFEAEGLFCDFQDTGSVCHATIDVGDPCDAASFGACGSKGQCNVVCQALNDRGQPCGDGCYPQYTCVDDLCVDPTWDSDSACLGFGPSPG